jgi:hypothetical protein
MNDALKIGPAVERSTYSGSHKRMNDYLHVSEIELRGLLKQVASHEWHTNAAWAFLGSIGGYLFDAFGRDGITFPQTLLLLFVAFLAWKCSKQSVQCIDDFEENLKTIKSQMWKWDETKNKYVPPVAVKTRTPAEPT